ncbi:MAG: hypothetical protein KF752_16100 [Pirellulaceae bacterium]|nr:hypothetical protein [Pirellulaceae bacterium]
MPRQSCQNEIRQQQRHCAGVDLRICLDTRQPHFKPGAEVRLTRFGVTSLPVVLLIIVLAVVATVLCYRLVEHRLGGELRTAIRKELSELFPRARVFVGRVAFDGPGQIIANDVRMALPIDGQRVQVLSAEQVLIQGKLDLASFIQQTARVQQIRLKGVQLDIWPLADGGWSVGCLKPHPKPNRIPPKIIVMDSSLRLRQSADEMAGEIVLHDLQAEVEPLEAEELYTVDSPTTTIQRPTRRQFRAQCSARSSGLVRNVVATCIVDPSTESAECVGEFSGLRFSRKLIDVLPPGLADRLSQLAGLECDADCSYFQISHQTSRPAEFMFQGRILSGRMQDPRLPYPLERLSSQFSCTNKMLQLRQMQAHSGEATLKIDTDIMGLELDSPMVIEAQVQNIDLDKRLYQSLPVAFQQHWDRLQLAGRVSGSVQLKFDGQVWQPSAAIDCQHVSLRPWLFPYPLTDVHGKVQYREGTLSSQQLQGRAAGQPLEASMSLSLAEGQWHGRLQCRSLGPVVIDEDLISALTPTGSPPGSAEEFVRSLKLAGAVELVSAVFERKGPEEANWHRTIDANVFGGRLQYDKFVYPIYNIRGRIFNQDQRWYLQGFEGKNDSARILCSGTWQQVPQGALPFRLDIDAHNVPIAEDLYMALPPRVRETWSQLQPSGSIDRVAVTIQGDGSPNSIETQVTIIEENHGPTPTGTSVRLEPLEFPYLLNDVSCHITYANDQVIIQRATAHHGATRLALTGQCTPRADGRWQADVQWLPTTRLMVDAQLVRALPKSVQESMLKLDFRGPVSLLGSSQIVLGDKNLPMAMSWNCQMDVEDGQFAGGEQVSALRGTVWVQGSSDGESLKASGRIAMDALRAINIPVTNLQGPFVVLDHKLYFGSAVQKVLPAAEPLPGQDVTATALAGTLKLSGYSLLDSGKLHLDAALENANLSTLLQEVGMQQKQPQAICNAYLKDFHGVPWNPQTFSGSGSIHLTDAKLYELPFMMRLFSVAAVNAADASAFQRADVDFKIDGDHIPLKVAADGDVLRLRGDGWTNLRRDIQLQLYTYVGRRVPIGQVISPLLADSRFATFMMVEVNGTLDNPEMQRKPFPQLEATWQQMFPEVASQQSLLRGMGWRH